MSILTGNQLGTLLGKALGLDLKLVRSITVHCNTGDLAVVTVERLVRGVDADRLNAVLEQYELSPKVDGNANKS